MMNVLFFRGLAVSCAVFSLFLYSPRRADALINVQCVQQHSNALQWCGFLDQYFWGFGADACFSSAWDSVMECDDEHESWERNTEHMTSEVIRENGWN